MKSHVLLLVLLQCLGCSGVPLYSPELESMANRGLEAALAEVNSVHAASFLYRATQGSVTRVIPLGRSTVDLMMVFSVKETECAKASGRDPQTCAPRPGFFVSSFPCSSRVRMSATSAQVVSLRCGRDDSFSSESSSEETLSRGRQHFSIPIANRAPAPAAPPSSPPVQRGRSLHSPVAEEQPRGDAFNNFVV